MGFIKSKKRARRVFFLGIVMLCVTMMVQASESAPPLWNVQVVSCEFRESIESTQSYVLYGGESKEVENVSTPDADHVYLLVDMMIEKERPGQGKFMWEALCVEDAEGGKVYRHPDDTFLEVHHFNRIKATDLTFGRNEGYICFEIPTKMAQGALTLVYLHESGEVTAIPLTMENGGIIDPQSPTNDLQGDD